MNECYFVRSRHLKTPWVGVRLKSILELPERIGTKEMGKPIEPMLLRVKKILNCGRNVKILTLSAQNADQVAKIKEWCKKQGLGELDVTDFKDSSCEEILG